MTVLVQKHKHFYIFRKKARAELRDQMPCHREQSLLIDRCHRHGQVVPCNSSSLLQLCCIVVPPLENVNLCAVDRLRQIKVKVVSSRIDVVV